MRRNLLYDGFLIEPSPVAWTRQRNKSYRTQDRGSTEFSTAGKGLRIVNGFKEILLICQEWLCTKNECYSSVAAHDCGLAAA